VKKAKGNPPWRKNLRTRKRSKDRGRRKSREEVKNIVVPKRRMRKEEKAQGVPGNTGEAGQGKSDEK